jgi:hypothetical protein
MSKGGKHSRRSASETYITVPHMKKMVSMFDVLLRQKMPWQLFSIYSIFTFN